MNTSKSPGENRERRRIADGWMGIGHWREGPKDMALQRSRFALGPGLLVTAAFVGPGTVTTASVAGAKFGYALLWALLFSVLATIVLQEMSARLGLVTRAGLGEALRATFTRPWSRWSCAILVVAAIGLGNAAYETGNITGAAAGLEIITGVSPAAWAGIIGVAGAALLLPPPRSKNTTMAI